MPRHADDTPPDSSNFMRAVGDTLLRSQQIGRVLGLLVLGAALTAAAGTRAVLATLDLDGPVLVVGHNPSEYAIESFAQLASIVLP